MAAAREAAMATKATAAVVRADMAKRAANVSTMDITKAEVLQVASDKVMPFPAVLPQED